MDVAVGVDTAWGVTGAFCTDPSPPLMFLGVVAAVVFTVFFSPPPSVSFSFGFGDGAMIKRVAEDAATVSGAAMGFPPVPSLLSDWGMLVRVVSDGGEANPRGRSLAFDIGDARYEEILAGVMGPIMFLRLSRSLSDKAVTDDDSDGLFRKLSFCSISLRFESSAAS